MESISAARASFRAPTRPSSRAGRQHYGGELGGRWVSPPASAAWVAPSRSPPPWPAPAASPSNASNRASISACAPAMSTSRPGSRRRPRPHRRCDRRQEGDLDRPPRQRGRSAAGAGARGVRPDMVTDQTSAHDPLNGYCDRLDLGGLSRRAAVEPAAVTKAAKESMAVHVRAMLAFHAAGVPTFDYGNNIRQMAKEEGVADAFAFPGFVPAYVRPLFCRGFGPFRWARAFRQPGRHRQDRRQGEGADPRRSAPAPLARHGGLAHRLPGSAGAHLLGRPRRRHRLGLASTRWWRTASSKPRS